MIISATSNRVVYIYALCEPDGENVRYVGQTVGLVGRYKEHMKPSQSRGTWKSNWVKRLRRQGLQPIMRELEAVSIGDDWAERERYWITYYRDLGFVLTNLSVGGEGPCGRVMTEEQCLQNGLRTKARFEDPEWKAYWYSRMHRGPLSDEHKAKVSAAMKRSNEDPEMRYRRGSSNRGKKISEETRKRMSEAARLCHAKRRATY